MSSKVTEIVIMTEDQLNSYENVCIEVKKENEELKDCLARISGTTVYMEKDEKPKAECMKIIRDIIKEQQYDE